MAGLSLDEVLDFLDRGAVCDFRGCTNRQAYLCRRYRDCGHFVPGLIYTCGSHGWCDNVITTCTVCLARNVVAWTKNLDDPVPWLPF